MLRAPNGTPIIGIAGWKKSGKTTLTVRLVEEFVRRGAKVATLEATLTRVDDGQELARARAQRIRTVDLDFPDGAVDDVPELPATSSDLSHWPGASEIAFHSSAAEHRIVRGEFGRPGPVVDWVRLLVPVVPDEEPTGWQRAVAVADFTNGLSAVVPFDGTSMFINPDLTVHLWREPVGEWIGTEALTRISEGHVPDAVYDAVREHFSEEELVNLALAVVAINGWNRLSIAFRAEAGKYRPGMHDSAKAA